MELSGLHLLLSYTCLYECDHCFVWGSPQQTGVMPSGMIDHILEEGRQLGTVEWIYFEGGEPFLYYATLLHGVRRARELGFRVGIVSNGYWATSEEDALLALQPLAGKIEDLSLSADAYHGAATSAAQVAWARAAAEALQIPLGTIAVAQPEAADAPSTVGQLPRDESAVMYRGRAAALLADRAPHYPFELFDSCPFEDLRAPGRVHVDPLGYLHLCQGIAMANLLHTPLADIVAGYDPDAHPIAGPLLRGGPAALAEEYGVRRQSWYADACHLCDETRRALRPRFPDILAPDQMYGVMSD